MSEPTERDDFEEISPDEAALGLRSATGNTAENVGVGSRCHSE